MTNIQTHYYRVRPLRNYITYLYPTTHIFIESQSTIEADLKFKTLINTAIIKDRLVYFQNIDMPLFRIIKTTGTELQYSDLTLGRMNYSDAMQQRLKYSKHVAVVI